MCRDMRERKLNVVPGRGSAAKEVISELENVKT